LIELIVFREKVRFGDLLNLRLAFRHTSLD